MEDRPMKRILMSATCAMALLGLAAGTVAAGEITGNGTSLQPLRANSECAFSGLDDADDDGFGRTQNWGQLGDARDFLRSIGVAPESLCNGHLNPLKD
jgi:hypothetical protein